MRALKPGGRLVAHAVTLESEALLLAAHARHRRRAGAALGRARRADRRLFRLAAGDARHAMGVEKAMSGRLYGIGVGPGDPELMTLKAVRILAEVPVIAYPAPNSGESSARAIAEKSSRPGARDRDPRADARRAGAGRVYERAAEEIAAHLDAGRDVAVLCEGDPFFYGSFMYLHARSPTAFRRRSCRASPRSPPAPPRAAGRSSAATTC